MYKNKNKYSALVPLCLSAFLTSAATATPMADFSFKSPSFSGNGYSSHVLTIENQEFNRRVTVAKDIQAALQAKPPPNKTKTSISL